MRYTILLSLFAICGFLQYYIQREHKENDELKIALYTASHRALQPMIDNVSRFKEITKTKELDITVDPKKLIDEFHDLKERIKYSSNEDFSQSNNLYLELRSFNTKLDSIVQYYESFNEREYEVVLFKTQEEHQNSKDSLNLIFFPVAISSACNYEFSIDGDTIFSSEGIIEAKRSYQNQQLETRLTDKNTGKQFTIKERVR